MRVDDVTYDEAVHLIEGFFVERRSRLVTTPNPEIVVRARQDPSYRALLNAADLNVPDGVGLLLAARLWGCPLRQQVRGTDLVYRLAEVSAQRGYRWFLLGAREGVAAEAADRLVRQYPGLVVAGTRSGGPEPEHDEASREAIRRAAPVDLLLVAYGAPAQERWLARNLPHLQVGVGIGVGGVFDFVAGRSRRAPVWVREAGFEWLYRLVTEPWRWRRQLALPRFALRVLLETPRRRLSRLR
ncbi:MAG TPA: WecB/TagA/CpsF family glycosyltransferase [Chloroflexota bacterium]